MSFSPVTPKGRIMALDVGDARIGVAMSDPLQITAQPLITVVRTKKGVQELVALIETHTPCAIIVGLPKMLSGEVGEQGEKTTQFAEGLRRKLEAKKLNPEFIFWDERLTTVSAERLIVGTKLKDKNRRALLDRVSATLILEAYLMSQIKPPLD